MRRSIGRALTAVAALVGLVGSGQGVLAAASEAAGGARSASAAVQLLPNIQSVPAFGLRVQVEGQRRALRLSAQIGNLGVGPLEVYPIANDCDGDGDPTNDRSGYQRIFADQDGDGIFTRGVDNKQTSRFAGCFHFHPQHNHWHFENWARYDLARLSDGVVVASGGKVSFCIIDSDHLDPTLPGSPAEPYYEIECKADDTEGLSVGWSDVYTAGLPGQKIPITRVRNGDYCVIVNADPDDLLDESDEGDNLAYVPVRLVGATVTVIGSSC